MQVKHEYDQNVQYILVNKCWITWTLIFLFIVSSMILALPKVIDN